jgi:uncharacterized membrane protein
VIWRSSDPVIEIPKRAAIVSSGPAVLATAALMAPYLSASGYSLVALTIFWFFSPVCHQDPARSFWLLGAPVAVCARCLGIYLGAAAGAWIPAPRRMLLSALALFAAVNLADVLTEAAAWHGNWKLARFLLGAFLGMAAGSLVANSIKRESAQRLRVSAVR